MEKKSIMITTLITVLLFSFVFFLIYIVYCFAFFDKNQEKDYLNIFNSGSYDFVYKNMIGQDNISKEDYNYSINLMFKRTKLNDIHHKYYNDIDVNDFMDQYYYGGYISMDDMELSFNGKTDLFSRRSLRYKRVKISTASGNHSIFGVMNNLNLLVDYNSTLLVDEKECEITSRACYFKYILGGLHTIEYKKEGASYFGIINVNADDQEININTLDNLVTIEPIVDGE